MSATASEAGVVTPTASGPTTENSRKTVLERLNLVPDEGWRVSGVSLYIVVAPETPLAQFTEPPADAPAATPAGNSDRQFWGRTRIISERTLYQMAIPATAPAPGASGDKDALAVEPSFPLHDLPGLLAQLFAAAYQRQSQLRAGGVQYVIPYIRTLQPPKAWVDAQARQAKQERRVGQALPWQEEKIPRVVQIYLRGALDLFDASPIGEPRGYYDHYDAHTQQTGRLAFGRYAAVLGGLSDETLRTFVTLLQSGEMASTGGLTRQTLVPTLSLIAQWNSNQDVRENIEQVAALKRSGDAATAGQIWISYALAVIGVALAFISYLRAPALLSPGLALLGVSCVIFALHAQSGRQGLWRVGATIFALGIVTLVVGFAADVAKLPIPFPLP